MATAREYELYLMNRSAHYRRKRRWFPTSVLVPAPTGRLTLTVSAGRCPSHEALQQQRAAQSPPSSNFAGL